MGPEEMSGAEQRYPAVLDRFIGIVAAGLIKE